MVEYAQLHCHTKYSIQDAIPNHKAYVDAIYDHNQQSAKYKCIAFAASDHGNIYGMVKHYNACINPDHKERAIKPLYACEVYHCEDVDNNPNNNRYHLVLIAVTQEGLTNLYEIVSHAGTHLIHGRQKDFPVTDLKFMAQHGKGIVALTACVAGIVPQYIVNGDDNMALHYIDELHNIFDKVYLEVQPHDFPEQLLVNNKLVGFSAQTGCKLVMTSDSHYINYGDNQYHNILKNMAHQKLFNTNNHLYTPEEMESYCIRHSIPLECISNTAEIANMSNVNPKPKDHRALLPVFPCPEGYNESTYLRKLSFEKLQEKIIRNRITNPKKYIEQMNYELEIICNAGFAGYFLILWDWFEWCRANDILCGPGRGCFEPEMMVTLQNGYSKPIKDIQIGECVINDDGYSNKVLDKYEYNVNEQMTEINIPGKNIRCTNDHKILTLVTDKCNNPSRKNVYCKNNCKNKNCNYRKAQKIEWVEAQNLKKGDMLLYPRPKLKQKNIFSVELTKYGNTENINNTIKIDKDFSEFIGLYLSNGWLIDDSEHRKYAVGNAFHKNSQDKIDRYIELVHKVFGNNIRISILSHKTRNVVQIMFHNKTIVNFINDICGHYALHKKIPDLLLVNDNECIKSLITGMMDTDSSYKDINRISYSSINYGMVTQLKMLFAHLGYYASITERVVEEENWHNEYKLLISGKQLETLKNDFLNKINITKRSYSRNDFLCDDKYFYFKVQDVMHYDYTGKVYDLHVENNHTYMINNCIVHNSAASSIISYALNITKVDPVKHGFFFERFLNKGRLEFPDIDELLIA